MSMTLGIVVEKRTTACGPWEPVTVDDLLAHQQFGRLSLASVTTECQVYTLAAPSAMAELLHGGWGTQKSCTPLQQGAGLPADAAAACRRDIEALAGPERDSTGWFTCARFQTYVWDAGRRELLDDDSWTPESFGREVRQEAAHLATTLAQLGDPADVRVIMFFV
jgi:hypothetical protein